jgi:lipoprotein-releasing system ATP-binding protein
MSETPEAATLVVRDLQKNYTSGSETLHILRGVSFSAKKGESVSITGASGSGKSTLLNIIGGLESFDAGEIRVNGAPLVGKSEKDLAAFRRRSVGFIFQFHYLLKDFTALENVMLSAYINGAKKKDALEAARGLLVAGICRITNPITVAI